jgi:hypothetical protein
VAILKVFVMPFGDLQLHVLLQLLILYDKIIEEQRESNSSLQSIAHDKLWTVQYCSCVV